METTISSSIRHHVRSLLKPSTRAIALAAGFAIGGAQAQTATTVIDLGAFESGGTAFPTNALVSQIPLGTLPAGSILRSVTMNYRLEAGDPYLGDLRVLFADSAGDNGVLQIVGNFDDGGYAKTASTTVTWNSGSDYSVGTTASQTLTPADGLPPIDLNTVEVWLHTGSYGGSWSGSVTLEYDVFVPAVIQSCGPGAVVGPLVDNAADIAWTVPYGTDVTTLSPTFTLSSGSCDRDSGGTYDFTSPVAYTVTDGETVNIYTVTVTVANAVLWNVAGSGVWDENTVNWLTQPGASPTTFTNGDEVIFDNPAGGTITIDPDMSPAFTTVSAASGTYIFEGGPIATGSLVKDGAGNLTVVTTNNTFSGGTTVNDGRLRLDLDLLQLGTGPIILNGGEIYLWRARPTNALVVNGGKVIAENGFNNNRFDGPITLNTTLTCDVFFQLTCSNTISGEGGLTKTQDGPMVISGTSTYTGPTTVTSGTLQFNSTDAVAPGDLSVNSGGAKANLNYTGNKQIGTLTLGGVTQIYPGTYGSLTSDADFKSNYFLGSGTVSTGDPESAAFITSFGTNVLGSIALIDAPVAGEAAISWYVPDGQDLATLAPDFVLSPGATCNDQTSGAIPSPNFSEGPVVYTVVSQNTLSTIEYTVTVSILPNDTSVTWNLASGGNWNLSSLNRIGQPSGITRPYFDGANAIFDNTSGGTIIIEPDISPLSTTVSAASGTYTFSGGPIATGSLIKDGGGTLTINDWNTYSGGTIIDNGTLYLNWPGDANPKTSLGSGPVTLNGGILQLNRNLLENEVTVNGGSIFLDNGFANTVAGAILLNVPVNITAQYTNHAISGDISGSGGFTMISSAGGGMILSGTNTYTGPTTVTGGTLRCDSPGAVAGGDWIISGGAVNLNYEGTRNIASLTLGEVEQTTPGTYGSVASGADFPSDTYFTPGSTGTVTIGGGGSAYDSWAGGPFLGTLTDPTPSLDFDLGGLATGIEWVVGGDPTDPGDDAGLTPTATTDGTYLIFTYQRSDAANEDPNTAIKVEYNTDLQGAWTEAQDTVDGVVIEVTPGSPADTVVVKIPKSLASPGTKLFARLNVEVTTP